MAELKRAGGVEEGQLLLAKVASLREKFAKLCDDSKAVRYIIEVRLRHLDGALASRSADERPYREWWQCFVNRHIADFLLRSGNDELAEAVIRETQIGYLVDAEPVRQCMRIVEAIDRHDCGPALAWCFEHRAALKRLESSLEFHFRKRHFIDMLGQTTQVEAVAYAKKHFASWITDKQHRDGMQAALLLLIVPPTTRISRYARLYDSKSAYAELKAAFVDIHHRVYSLPPSPPLTCILQAGLSALKTPSCSRPEDSHPACPVCSGDLKELASHLPNAHFESTRLVCRISGDPIDEDNPPMVMPNGYAYSHRV